MSASAAPSSARVPWELTIALFAGLAAVNLIWSSIQRGQYFRGEYGHLEAFVRTNVANTTVEFLSVFSEEERVLESSFQAVVQSCYPLVYTGGEDNVEDRPNHIRAASSLSWGHHNQLIVLQDDVNFVGLIDYDTDLGIDIEKRSPSYSPKIHEKNLKDAIHRHQPYDDFGERIGDIWSLSVPRIDGYRQFHKERKNKMLKLDFEASVYLPEPEKILYAFGSGSAKGRSKILVWHDHIRHQEHFIDPHSIELKDAGSFYNHLRAEKSFSGAELNLEGVSLVQQASSGKLLLRLFQRGNGDNSGHYSAISATADIDFDEFRHYLEDPINRVPPRLFNIVQFNLGDIFGVRLSFTDAIEFNSDTSENSNGNLVIFIAGAEDSPDSIEDGGVMGSTIGIIQCINEASHWKTDKNSIKCEGKQVLLRHPDGRVFREKAEGIVIDQHDQTKAILVVDPDDPMKPGLLCSVSLDGFSSSAFKA